jgi:hypothetical protein
MQKQGSEAVRAFMKNRNSSSRLIAIQWICFMGLIWLFLAAGCRAGEKAHELNDVSALDMALPTPPSTLPELIWVLQNGNHYTRCQAAMVLADWGPDAAPAVPALIDNLFYDPEDRFLCRRRVIFALGEIGPAASSAVPHLMIVVRVNDSFNAKDAAEALEKIVDVSAVPELIKILYQEDRRDYEVKIVVARTLERLTNKNFGGRGLGGTGYTLRNLDGTDTLSEDRMYMPYIAINALEWWEREGQYQEWPEIATEMPPLP